MNQIEFYEGKKRKVYDVPSSWDELSDVQLVQVLETRHRIQNVDVLIVEYIAILLNLGKRLFLRSYLRKRLGSAGLADTALITSFLFTAPSIKFNKFPLIKIGSFWKPSTILYGPPLKKLLTYMCFLEWIKSETYYRQYLYYEQQPAERTKALNKLVAALYRPKVGRVDVATHNGDPRSPYNDYKIEEFAAMVAKVPLGVRLAIFYHFQTHRSDWALSFKHVYGGQAQVHDDYTPEQLPAPNDLELFRAMKNLAGGSLHLEAMGNVPASVALLELDDKIADYKKLKANNNGA